MIRPVLWYWERWDLAFLCCFGFRAIVAMVYVPDGDFQAMVVAPLRNRQLAWFKLDYLVRWKTSVWMKGLPEWDQQLSISETRFNCHCNALRLDHLGEFVCLTRCWNDMIWHGSRTIGSGVTGRSDGFTIAGWKTIARRRKQRFQILFSEFYGSFLLHWVDARRRICCKWIKGSSVWWMECGLHTWRLSRRPFAAWLRDLLPTVV